ncbi:MAG: hypothetical protein FD189_732 [Elusimicrobia bacterium]|nr:MAG: hypothetical protein FD154_663 [Elusimicrobiota bacterium]KAF0156978.1 MAG: hypothetical protein FD189_732 [Elusimicrobiota bacterium]
MNKVMLTAVLFSFGAGMAVAEDRGPASSEKKQERLQAKDDSSWQSWYNNFYKGLRSKVQKKFESKTRVSAVAAVRGSKTGRDASELYWKGGVSEEARKKADAERKALGDAVELVVNGDAPAGRAALEKFIKDNPESVYVPDAREALEMLPAADAAPAPQETAPADPAPASEKSGDGK